MRFSLLRATVVVATLATLGGAATVVAGSAGPEPTHRQDLERLRGDADALTALGVTGVQARLVLPDGTSQVATSGVADLPGKRPVPPDGHFRIASTAKSFVAVVALQLVGEGRLGLDDTVERWLPGLVRGNGNDGRRITVRQLLQHTSGMPDDFPDHASAEDYRRHRDDVHTPESLLARALKHPPAFPPGTAWRYSSTGFVLVDLIIERVTGRPWHEEVSSRIIKPLRLTGTSWPGRTPTLPEPHARAYQPFETPTLVDVTDQIVADPEGAIISTTRDLNTFFRALLGGRLLRPAQLAEMTRTMPIGPDFAELLPDTRYGLGLFERPLPCGGTYWSHGGGDGGYLTDSGVTADGRRSVVVSMSSVLGRAPEDHIRQQRAMDTLVGNALCGGE
ncbi:serine hydrolase [Micromonospora sp. WMMD1102]|uniref:serine hydrolase domain-containing protein n=1 Tax=Micromonospora sp. WMMD1102 TaxID=3016105 RepID=UPI002415677F|nr:serine hydrolase domain-containing protein [Micromonospora sp. WMMD1102]MDG4784791.1 serine hydrolase [Micromonospora sp. WMMD1102]